MRVVARSVVRQPALVDLDRQVRDVERRQHRVAIRADLARLRGHDRHDAATPARTELPDMEVGDANVVDRLEPLANDLLVARRRHDIEQLPTRLSAKTDGPPGNNTSTDQSHQRI